MVNGTNMFLARQTLTARRIGSKGWSLKLYIFIFVSVVLTAKDIFKLMGATLLFYKVNTVM